MDLSKLPKLSQTPEQPASPMESSTPATPGVTPPTTDHCAACGLPLRPGARFCDACGAATTRAVSPAPGAGAEAWLSIAMGIILLFIGPRLIEYLVSPSTFPSKWSFTDEQGAPLAYTRSVFFFGDLALTSFAVVLIVEGLVLFLGRRVRLQMAAMTLTIIVTLMNLVYVIMMFQKGYGTQLISVIAVAFGVYIAIQQWATIRLLRRS